MKVYKWRKESCEKELEKMTEASRQNIFSYLLHRSLRQRFDFVGYYLPLLSSCRSVPDLILYRLLLLLFHRQFVNKSAGNDEVDWIILLWKIGNTREVVRRSGAAMATDTIAVGRLCSSPHPSLLPFLSRGVERRCQPFTGESWSYYSWSRSYYSWSMHYFSYYYLSPGSEKGELNPQLANILQVGNNSVM